MVGGVVAREVSMKCARGVVQGWWGVSMTRGPLLACDDGACGRGSVRVASLTLRSVQVIDCDWTLRCNCQYRWSNAHCGICTLDCNPKAKCRSMTQKDLPLYAEILGVSKLKMPTPAYVCAIQNCTSHQRGASTDRALCCTLCSRSIVAIVATHDETSVQAPLLIATVFAEFMYGRDRQYT